MIADDEETGIQYCERCSGTGLGQRDGGHCASCDGTGIAGHIEQTEADRG